MPCPARDDAHPLHAVRGDFATFIIPGAALILAFFGAGYCVCCQARREDRRKALEDYDARFSLAHRRASAKARIQR
jgi:hypothetical protein